MSKPYVSLVIVALCVACGSSFEVDRSGGGSGVAGAAHAGESSGGQASSAGAPSGGAGDTSDAGSAGSTDTGGSSAGAGGSRAGAGGSSAGAGGSAAGAAGNAGTSTGGSAGAADCATLKTDYQAAVQKARVCDSGSTDECSASSTLPAVGCGCPVLVNEKSKYTTLAKDEYKAIQTNKCDVGPICNVACLAYASASCAAQAATAGGGFVCAASRVLTPN